MVQSAKPIRFVTAWSSRCEWKSEIKLKSFDYVFTEHNAGRAHKCTKEPMATAAVRLAAECGKYKGRFWGLGGAFRNCGGDYNSSFFQFRAFFNACIKQTSYQSPQLFTCGFAFCHFPRVSGRIGGRACAEPWISAKSLFVFGSRLITRFIFCVAHYNFYLNGFVSKQNRFQLYPTVWQLDGNENYFIPVIPIANSWKRIWRF